MEIIAEIGSSPVPQWNFDLWCGAARNAGASKIKVQLFRAEHFPQMERESKRRVEFPRDRIMDFVQAAHRFGLQCGASVFDEEAVELAAEYLDFLKLAAREQNNKQLIGFARACANQRNKPIYRSITNKKYRLFWLGNDESDKWEEDNNWEKSIFEYPYHPNRNLTELLTISKYPVGLVQSLFCLLDGYFGSYGFRKVKQKLRRWGWSSHTRGILDCVLAARLGALVIEKHLALTPQDIEAKHSLLPKDFARMVKWCKR